jgi:hypothetical protein
MFDTSPEYFWGFCGVNLDLWNINNNIQKIYLGQNHGFFYQRRLECCIG